MRTENKTILYVYVCIYIGVQLFFTYFYTSINILYNVDILELLLTLQFT